MKMKALGLHHKAEGGSPQRDTVLISKDLPLYILCNGVGEGPSATRTAKETAHLFSYHVQEEKKVLMAFNEDPSNQKRDLVKKTLHEIIQKMNQKIYLQNQKHPPEKAVGTTLLFGLFIGSDVFLGNLGNGKVFLCRGEESFILMNGNSKWDVLLKSGKVTEKEKVGHPSHYEPHKYVGSHKECSMDLFHMEMIEKDFLLLSTDALSNSMKPNDVLELTKKETGLQMTTEKRCRFESSKELPKEDDNDQNLAMLRHALVETLEKVGRTVSRVQERKAQLPLGLRPFAEEMKFFRNLGTFTY